MKTVWLITVGLVVFLTVLLFVDIYFGESSFFQAYVQGLSTETIGIILTLILVEIILVENRKKESRENAKKDLLGAVKVLNVYIEKYNLAAFNLSYKYIDYKSQRETGLEKNFPFNNFQEIFSPNPSIISYHKTKVEAYFERLDDLKETVKTVLFQKDLSHFSELSGLLQNYLIEIEKFYPKNGILDDIKNPEVLKLMKEMLESHKGEVEYRRGNMLNKYVRLYRMVNFHIDFIENYRDLIAKI